MLRALPSGTIALALLSQKNVAIDLLLTDLVMPQMNGRQLARRACELYPSLKIVFMSGYVDELTFGADEPSFTFVQKPLTPEVLLAKIREALESGPRDVNV